MAERRILEASANGKRNAKLPPDQWQEDNGFEHRIKYERLVLLVNRRANLTPYRRPILTPLSRR
jgi:hypothetical protein